MAQVGVYGRYSSESQREASIDDQYRNCERRAKQEGWPIVERYQDKAISGSTSERSGYQAMLRDAKAKRFDILLVDDLSRLTRDEGELIDTRKRLVYWGVRLIGVSDGFDTAQKGHKIQASFHGIKNEIYLDELRDKTRRGLEGQALHDYHTGGRAYGYTHVPIYHPTNKDRYGKPEIIGVKLEVDPEQAMYVVKAHTLYAEGYSPRWLAAEFNRLGIPAPGAAYDRQRKTSLTGTWSASVFHGDPQLGTGLLHNPLYIGKVIWNRREWVKNPETDRRVPRLRPKSEWIIRERPELRIVPQALWDKVQARCKSRPLMKKGTRVINGKYPMSSLLICGVCGSRYVMADAYRYGCAGYLNRGACTNTIRVRRDLVESRCLEGLRRELFTPERFTVVIKEITRLLAERKRQQQPDIGRVQKELATIESEIANLLNAIKQGIVTASTKDELERLEAQRDKLRAQLQDGTQHIDKTLALLLPRAKERYEALVNNLSRLPQRQVDPLREQLRHLVGEITLRPQAEGHLEAEMVGRYEGLLKLAVGGNVKNAVGCGGRI